MGSVRLYDIARIINLWEFGVDSSGNNDCAGKINDAIQQAANAGLGGVYLPPGTYRVDSPILLRDNIQLLGAGVQATIIKLGPTINNDVIQNQDQSAGNNNIAIKNLRIDGNRANNTSGTWHGIDFNIVTDALIENVEIVSCRTDGILLTACIRPQVIESIITDCGTHGLAVAGISNYGSLVAVKSFNNSTIASIGVGDGINLAGTTTGFSIIGPVCYDSAGTPRQGYGVREASGSSCNKNIIAGGSFKDNATGTVSLVGAASTNLSDTITINGLVNIAGAGDFGARLGQLLEVNTTANYGGLSINTWSTTPAERALVDINKSNSAVIGNIGSALADNEQVGTIAFRGSDGVEFFPVVEIAAIMDGAGAAGDMPGRLVFSTTAAAASAGSERLRIDSTGLSTFSGAVALGANNLTTTGTLSATGARITQAYFTNLTSSNAVTVDSWSASKYDITGYAKKALDVLGSVEVIQFRHNEDRDPSRRLKLGIRAENLMASEPLATPVHDYGFGLGDGPSVDMMGLAALNTKGVQELLDRVRLLEAALAARLN